MTYTTHQMALIERHRDINVDYEWWRPTIEHFVERVNELGLDVKFDDVQFSGFWSQGDGASFTFTSYSLGYVLDRCTGVMAKHAALDDGHREAMLGSPVYVAIIAFAGGFLQEFEKYRLCGQAFLDDHLGCVTILARRTGYHYSHSNTVTARFECGAADLDDAKEVFGVDLESVLDDNDDWLDKAIKAIADALYDELESEHDYQTEDDQVWESIVANELDEPEEEDVDG